MNPSGGWDTARPPWVPRPRFPTMLTLNTPGRPPAVSHPTPHRQTMSRLVIGRGFGGPTAPPPPRRPPPGRVRLGLVGFVGAPPTPPPPPRPPCRGRGGGKGPPGRGPSPPKGWREPGGRGGAVSAPPRGGGR